MSNADYRAPLYQQLRSKIESKLDSGEYLPGQKLPSERQLAETYKISRMTVKKAIHSLVEDGKLYQTQGSGTFVSRPVKRDYQFNFGDTSSKHGMTQALKQSGAQVSTSVLNVIENANSKYINTQLDLPSDQLVYGLHRLRISDDVHFAVEYTYTPAKFFPDFLTTDFRNVGLYDYFEQRGHNPKFFQQYLIVVEAGPKEAKLLNVDVDDPLFKINFISSDAANRIIEFTESYINPKNINLEYAIRS